MSGEGDKEWKCVSLELQYCCRETFIQPWLFIPLLAVKSSRNFRKRPDAHYAVCSNLHCKSMQIKLLDGIIP